MQLVISMLFTIAAASATTPTAKGWCVSVAKDHCGMDFTNSCERCNSGNNSCEQCCPGCKPKTWRSSTYCGCSPPTPPPTPLPAAWSLEAIPQPGNASFIREYYVYTPSNYSTPTGVMMFFHGSGMTDLVRDYISGPYAQWNVAENAERYGFVGVVPKGSPCQDAAEQGAFCWNVNNPEGTNEVELAHAIMRNVSERHSLPATAKKVVLGFSNGAAMADLLGCHYGNTLYTAHVGVFYHPNADFPSTCEVETDPCSKWAGVGTLDPFLASIGVAGLHQQFATMHAHYNCTDVAVNSTAGIQKCMQYPHCPALGQLCTYDNTFHAITPQMTPAAWEWLGGVDGAVAAPACLAH